MSVARTEKTRDAVSTLRIPRQDEPRRPSVWKRALKLLVALILIAAVAVGGFVLAQRFGWVGVNAVWIPEALRSRPEVRVVQVIVETGRSADALVVATGYVESRRQAMIGARSAGRIEVVNVEEGSRVKLGQVLAVLEHKDIDAALDAAKATLTRTRAELVEHEVEIARSKAEFDRIKKLRQRNTISEAEFDEARFQYDAAVARRDSLQAAIVLSTARVRESEQFKQNMIIRAPFDGTVISKDAEVGESILPGGMGEASGRGSVVTIADLDHLEVDCDVKEDYISRVKSSAPAEVAVDAVPDRRYQGRVRKIIPMGDRARATIKVKVEITDADARLFPEMSATVYFLAEANEQQTEDSQRRIFCQTEADLSVGEQDFVWLVNADNRAERVSVSTGDKRDGRTEVLAGLSGGERVIVSPPPDLENGQLVKLRE